MKVTQYLTADKIKELTQPSDLQGWMSVLFDWLVIAASLTACALFPNPLVILFAMILIGGRQLALAILVHECAHHSLFKTRVLNDIVGKYFCGAPVWQSLRRYREHHLKHHNLAGTAEDPDYSLVSPFPVSKKSFYRKLFRDLTGISGLKRIYGLLMMDLGFITYTAAADPKKIDQTGRTLKIILSEALPRLIPVLFANLLLFGICFAVGKPWLYLIWLGGYLSFFSIFVRVRSMAEHACMQMDLNPLYSTRTTLANPIARFTVAPHHVNFHLEHHYLMKTPCYQLPELHKVLKEAGAYQEAKLARGYFEVLKICQL